METRKLSKFLELGTILKGKVEFKNNKSKDGMLFFIFTDCIYIYIYIYTHIELSVIMPC